MCNSQDTELPKCPSTGKWIYKLWYRILFGKRKTKLSTDKCYNVDEPRKHGTEKRPVTKDHILYYPICVKWNLNRQIYRNR